MSLIKIDLRTLKKNPNAGNTVSYRQGKIEAELNFVCYNHKILEKIQDMIYPISQTVKLPDGICEVHALVKQKYINKIFDKLLKLGVKAENIQYTLKNNVEPIYHRPEPEYFYKYLRTKVKCEHCFEEFPHNYLEDDERYDEESGDYYFVTNICPACGAGHCCDYSLETLEQALRRKNDKTNKRRRA